MEGRGVTNYSVDKPSYGYSTETTEFDDALLSRGIITFEQAMIAKGATPTEALRLSQLHENEQRSTSSSHDVSPKSIQNEVGNGNHGCSDESIEDDEQFMKNYREKRLKELKSREEGKQRRTKFGDVLHIARSDWNREVNEASMDGLWVLVNLTRSSSCVSPRHDELCDKVQQIMEQLADRFEGIKFVSIPSNSAIENWPVQNLPTLFCYRYGKLQHQLIGVDAFGGVGLNIDRVEWRLACLGVVETDLREEPEPSHSSSNSPSVTMRDVNDDYDDVD
jgi:hypothetical protein